METLNSFEASEIFFHANATTFLAGDDVTADGTVLNPRIVRGFGDRAGKVMAVSGYDREERFFRAWKGPNYDTKEEGEWIVQRS